MKMFKKFFELIDQKNQMKTIETLKLNDMNGNDEKITSISIDKDLNKINELLADGNIKELIKQKVTKGSFLNTVTSTFSISFCDLKSIDISN